LPVSPGCHGSLPVEGAARAPERCPVKVTQEV